MSLHLDTLAYTNHLRRLPPIHKFLFAIAMLTLALCSHPFTQVGILVWLSVWIVVYAKIPANVYRNLLLFTALFWLSSLPTLLLNGIPLAEKVSVQTDVWVGWDLGSYYAYVTIQGMKQSLSILWRSLSASACLYFIIFTIPFPELLQIFRRFGLPSLLSELLLLMYRFIFILLRASHELWTAQQARGGYRNWHTTMRSLGLLIGQLLRRTLENYHQVSLSLASRGFTGEFHIVHSRQYRASKRYILEAIAGCLVILAIEGGQYAIGV